jgi:hypothetical protein
VDERGSGAAPGCATLRLVHVTSPCAGGVLDPHTDNRLREQKAVSKSSLPS